MNTKELEQLLEAGVETQRIDFKESCTWNVEKLAKDVLAFSNVRDGGYIIIGVKQTSQGFERKGILEEHKNTYTFDVMKDQMAPFADPCVNFKVDFPNDKTGMPYVIIYVYEFEEVLVICKKNSEDTRKGVIYFRNRTRRWESAPISNSYDMRDIIERATVKIMRKFSKLGLIVPESLKIPKSKILLYELRDKREYDEEIRDIL